VDHAEVQAKLSEYESPADKMPAGKARPGEKCRLLTAGDFGPTGDVRAARNAAEKVVEAAHRRERIKRIFWDLRRGSLPGDLAEEACGTAIANAREGKVVAERGDRRDGRRRYIRFSRRRVAGD